MVNRKQLTHDGPHKYFQTRYKTGTVLYRCGLMNCSHFVYEPLIIGRLSICFRCNDIFIITKRSLRSKKMHCESCTRDRYNKVKGHNGLTEELDKTIDNLFGITIDTEIQTELVEQINNREKGE